MEKKNRNIWVWIFLGVLGVILFLYLNRSRYPSQYDCLKLGSDNARASCLIRYYPDVAGCKKEAEEKKELRVGLCEDRNPSDYDLCVLQAYILLQDEQKKCLPVIK